MLRKMHLAPVAAAALALMATDAGAFDFHGYLRSGTGQNDKGGTQQCFQLPGAYAKYRLGNECETYGELGFDQNLYDGKDGVKFDYHMMLAVNSAYANQQDYESLTGNGHELAFRQAWVEAKGLPGLPDGTTVWAGKRYYERQDIHINDFYYWDPSGYGGGIQNIPVGPVKVSYALFGNSSTPLVANNNNTPPTYSPNTSQGASMLRHDLRATIPLPLGDLTVGLELNSGKTASAGTAKSGQAYNVQWFVGNLLGGFNKLAYQHGEGSANSLVYGYPNYGDDSSHKTDRFVELFQWQANPAFSGMATVIYQNQKNNYKWISYGVRPVWHVSDYFKVQFEYDHDEVKPNGLQTAKLDKFTIAPTLVAGRGFWARPELRVYYTKANWNAAARDQWGGVLGGTGGVYGTSTNGDNYGVQLETWF